MLKTPVIVLNMKTYTESTGKNALDIAKMMDKVSIETGINMAVSVQSIDIKECSDNINYDVCCGLPNSVSFIMKDGK